MRISEWMKEVVCLVRLELYNRGLACGGRAIRQRIEEFYSIVPAPSLRTIERILAAEGLTHGRTGWYEGEEGCPAGRGLSV
jgi:hypothetical protein